MAVIASSDWCETENKQTKLLTFLCKVQLIIIYSNQTNTSIKTLRLIINCQWINPIQRGHATHEEIGTQVKSNGFSRCKAECSIIVEEQEANVVITGDIYSVPVVRLDSGSAA